ncbi:oxygen-dependent coproporphyrinogen oxidase [Haliangium sp.]|uniref:oxygen-dependent coproporphyrinogen oxidase n=1 Tax=Haliangium sp. TaxID=2663208 RepID=UPI003D09728E
MSTRFDRAAAFFQELQTEICDALATEDGKAGFSSDQWTRDGGGGGLSRVIRDGAVFEKGGVNWSRVEGELPEQFAAQIPGEGRAFRATGVSLVLHPCSPMIPTTHANFRYLEKGEKSWFGGGADLTPYYLFREDAVHFHQVLAEVCDQHAPIGDYPRFKKWCDEYFFLPHRGETRGVGGLFFDYLEGSGDDAEAQLERTFEFVRAAGRSFIPAYLPIVQRRRDESYGDRERQWQLVRRGRYVEFNLIYDRGTVFGLKTNGRTESILMSLPPLVRWEYDLQPEPGSREAELVAALEPTDWLGR